MATQTYTMLIDDLDGTEAQETVKFGLDGTTYTIDLNGVHAKEIREALAPFIAAGVKLGRIPVNGTAPKQPARPDKAQAQAMRDFARLARERGVLDLPEIKERGRVHAKIEAAYHKYGGIVPTVPEDPADPKESANGVRGRLDQPAPPAETAAAKPRKRASKAASKPAEPFKPAPSSQGTKGQQRELNRLYRLFWRDAPMKLGLPAYKGSGKIPPEVIEAYDNQ